MPKKNKQSIENEVQHYSEYFKNDLEAIEEELKKSKEYSEIIDSEIKKLSTANSNFGPSKGSQHYLIEHIGNAVQLQTQRQGLRRDRFTIKKAILDYAAKFAEEDNDLQGEDLSLIIRNVISRLNNNDDNTKELIDSPNLDDEIDRLLDDKEEEEV